MSYRPSYMAFFNNILNIARCAVVFLKSAISRMHVFIGVYRCVWMCAFGKKLFFFFFIGCALGNEATKCLFSVFFIFSLRSLVKLFVAMRGKRERDCIDSFRIYLTFVFISFGYYAFTWNKYYKVSGSTVYTLENGKNDICRQYLVEIFCSEFTIIVFKTVFSFRSQRDFTQCLSLVSPSPSLYIPLQFCSLSFVARMFSVQLS